jgi:DNA polymerase family B
LIDYIKNNKIQISWIDKIISLEIDHLIRTVSQTIVEYKNGDILSISTLKKCKKIHKIKPQIKIDKDIITADLETYLDKDNNMVPYLAYYYQKNKKGYIFDNNVNILFQTLFRQLFNRKNRGYKIYFHNLSGFYGFFYCKIIISNNLLYPILQIYHNSKDGLRTIAPLGEWEGIYFSEELYNAEKYGYKFEVLWGYIFESDYIFKDFVDNIYILRLNYPKSDPMNYIAKLLLNSLYGRFGMDDNFTNTNKTYYFSNSTKSIPSEAILRYLINGREEQLKLFKEKNKNPNFWFLDNYTPLQNYQYFQLNY